MSSLPRFFGEDSKWLPHYSWGEICRLCEGAWDGVRKADHAPAPPGLPPACEDPYHLGSSWLQASPGPLSLMHLIFDLSFPTGQKPSEA